VFSFHQVWLMAASGATGSAGAPTDVFYVNVTGVAVQGVNKLSIGERNVRVAAAGLLLRKRLETVQPGQRFGVCVGRPGVGVRGRHVIAAPAELTTRIFCHKLPFGPAAIAWGSAWPPNEVFLEPLGSRISKLQK
jgi:hypothetical protein